jgi:hypothetical protein
MNDLAGMLEIQKGIFSFKTTGFIKFVPVKMKT